MAALPVCPDALLDVNGQPRLGAYAGRMKETSLTRLAGPGWREGLERLTTEKRWHYVCVATPELFVGGAIVMLGYMANAFVYVFDRREKRMLAEKSMLVPPQLVEIDDLAAEARAKMRRLRSKMRVEASVKAGRFISELSGGPFVEIWLREGAPVALTAACSLAAEGGGIGMTQKTVCMPADGEVRVGKRVFKIEGALAGLDYTHGFLARETRWRWAQASGRLPDGRLLGLNLVEGHNDGEVTENGLWIGDELTQPGHAHFEFDDADPMRPWRITTDDGRVDLRFVPEGKRAEDIDLKLVVSQYVQPMGTFDGIVKDAQGGILEVAGLPGVVERHRARW
jgi:hypothetical protein